MSKTIYTHLHHIIPRHMGGSDDQSNLIELTVEEHAEAHRILYEEYGNEFDKIAWKALSGQISSEEARILAVKEANTNRKQSKEHIEKRMRSRAKYFEENGHPNTGRKLPNATEERKRKISEALKGGPGRPHPHSEETKQKLSAAAQNRPRYECPCCGKKIPKANLVRDHGLNGEKCKFSLLKP